MKKGIRLVSYNFLLRIFVKLMKQVFIVFVFCMAVSFHTGTARAELPVTGVPVPGLAFFDDEMQWYMELLDIRAGVLAVSKGGCVVYQRGFGWLKLFPFPVPLPENTPMRLASVEKPITAAVIRHLVADSVISLNDFVFDVDQWSPMGERRLLDAHLPSSTYYPYNDVYGDVRFDSIRVEHLLLHQGGWDSDAAGFDPQFAAIQIAEAMRIPSPPGRVNTVRYMLSQPLQFAPGTDSKYSNFGYMLLSLIIEQETGQQHTDVIRQRVLTPGMWVPATELFPGRTFSAHQSDREPYYSCPGCYCVNVFDPDGPNVKCPYGGWDHESMAGHGNLVASAAPLLRLLDNYYVEWPNDDKIGMPLSNTVNGDHNGSLDGTSTVARQRDDSINVVVLFAKRHDDWEKVDYARTVARKIYAIIDAGNVTWPTLCVDGFWVDFNASSSGFGGYDDPFHTMDTALAATADGTKLRIKQPGTSNWTGTISTKMLIDAPFGTAIIGQ